MITNVIITLLVINVYTTYDPSKASRSTKTFVNGCDDFGKPCDPNRSPFCCNNGGICKAIRSQNFFPNTFVCLSPAKLGDLCRDDVDCLRLDHAVCNTDTNQCECLPNYGVLRGNGRCVALIGGPCRVHADCQVPNAICFENECQCRKKFIKMSQKQCVGTSIGRRCGKDLDCNDILHISCSVDKKCVCKNNHILIDNSTCVPLLDEFCWTDEKCAVANSVCYKNKCQCESDYTAATNTHCIKMKLNVPCRKKDDCADVPNAVCSFYGRCICKDSYIAIGTEECRAPPDLTEMYR